MSNTIQTKRGTGKPDGKLAPYELGYDINSGFLYIGGELEDDDIDQGTKKYGEAQGIKVDFATSATSAAMAQKAQIITNSAGAPLNMGKPDTPIYLNNGIFQTCGGATISGTIEKAEMLSTSREIKVNLSLGTFASFNGQNNIETGVTGTLPINKGGTGATTASGAITNLGLDSRYLNLSGGGTISASKSFSSNESEWLITLSSLGTGTSPTNFGTGIKFHVYKYEPARWAGIEGYASEVWANQTGLRFTTKSSGDGTYTATFTQGRFTAPIISGTLNTNNYGSNAPSAATSIGTLYFQVVS